MSAASVGPLTIRRCWIYNQAPTPTAS